MEHVAQLRELLALWVFAAALLVWQAGRRPGVGLLSAYVITFWIRYWPAALLYVLPWYTLGYSDFNAVYQGFEQSFYGVVAFVAGGLLVGPLLARLVPMPARPAQPMKGNLPGAFAIAGLVGFVLVPFSHRITGLTALVTATNQLLLIGICLGAWRAWHARDRRGFLFWCLAGMSLPVLTVAATGFLNSGLSAAVVVAAFIAAFYRPRWRVAAALVVGGFLGLSLYATYMRDRAEIREVIWGNRPVSERVARLAETASQPEWFSLHDPLHMVAVDIRLNQSYLVGAAVSHIEHGHADFARGETVRDAVIALVPRAIWPGKPVRAGSGDLVAEHTGMQFGENTSVGIGQVMEFYINFGTVGVIVGFLILGAIIGFVDRKAGMHLREGNALYATIWFLPGLGLLQSEGSLVDIFATTGASLAVALVLTHFVIPLLRDEYAIATGTLDPGPEAGATGARPG